MAHRHHGGDVSSVRVRDSPPPPSPPPPPCPPGPLSYQGSIATGHTYGGAEGARKFFFIPLANVASLPAQAVEHPNAILEPNLDSNTHPNPQPAPNPTPNPTHDPNPSPNPSPNRSPSSNPRGRARGGNGSLCPPPPTTTPNCPTWDPPPTDPPDPPPNRPSRPPPPPPPPRGPSAHFCWGGESRTKARRRPPRDRYNTQNGQKMLQQPLLIQKYGSQRVQVPLFHDNCPNGAPQAPLD